MSEGSRIRALERSALRKRSDTIGFASFPEFLVSVPLNKTVPGEETYAAEHVGTQFASRSWGKPMDVFFWPKSGAFQISNGHHRAAEAKVRGMEALLAWVSIGDEERGYGALTEEKLARKRMEA